MSQDAIRFVLLASGDVSAPEEQVVCSVAAEESLEATQKAVASALHIALWKSVSFVALESGSKPTASTDGAAALETIEDLRAHAGDVGVLVSGRRLRDVPGPSGGLPFVGSYSEIYPDFIGNQQRLLDKWGHLVHVAYMGKHVYYTDDPDIASVALSESEYFRKELTTDHPLYALHEALPNALFTAHSTNPAWAKAHKFMQVALGGKAMRNYAKVMDASAKKIVNVFRTFQENSTLFEAFPWTMRAAGNTIGQIVTGRDLKMLDSPDSSIAPVLLHIGHNLAASQNLYRKGKVYRMLPQTPERRAAKEADAFVTAFLKGEMTRTIDEYKSEDRPMKDAALETKSLTDYVLHALDEDGEKMPMYLAIENISTLLGAGQVTTSSLLAWLLMTLSDHPREAEELYAALLDAGLTRETEELPTEKLNAIDRLDWFVKETQRLYNPAFQPTRCALQDVVVPGGYFVRKGSQVTTALHAVMVNKEHWDDPYKFDVGRWGTEKVQHRHSHAYIPFAAGGRGCIGQSLALAEVKVILTRWVLNFRFENVTGESVVYDPDFSLFRPLNLKIRVHAQEDAETFLAAHKADAPEPTADKEPPATERPPVGRTDLPAFYAVHASNTGTCKGFASELTRRARELGFADVKLLSMEEGPLVDADATAELVAKDHILVVVTCTYNGEPPEAAIDLDTTLDKAVKDKDEHRFAGLRYTVFGCGNKQWGPTYQAFPNKVNASLKTLGAEQWFEKGSGDADDDQDRDWSEWSTKFWGQVAAKNGIDLANPQGGQSEAGASSSVSDAIRIAYQPVADAAAKSPRAAPLQDFAESSVVENRELVDDGANPPRGMRLLTLSLPPGATYRAGDHVEIVPENRPEAVETVLAKLHLVEQARFSVEVLQEDSLNASSLASRLADLGAMDIREALTYHADLSAPLQRSALQHISALLPDGDKAKAELEALADPSADKDTVAGFARKNRNFAALLAHYPSIGGALTLKDLLLCVKSIATRRYSIASSPVADGKTLKICVGVNPLVTEEGTLEGLCSGFLKSCEPGHKIFVRVRPSQEPFHLPAAPDVPVTMVAAGTGIAPFLGFLEERKAQGMKLASHGGTAVQCKLYYGTSERDMSELRKLLHVYIDEGYADIEAVYSGDHGSRMFAQDLLVRDGLDVWSALQNAGRFYVCGSALRVGSGVEQVLGVIAEQLGGKQDGAGLVKELKRSGQLSEDVFG